MLMNKLDKKIKKALKTGAPVMTEDSLAAIDRKIADIESRVSKWKLFFLATVRIAVILIVLCAAAFLILPNVSDTAAEMMREIPFVGGLVDLIKIR